jgi:pimeloyl-ACP methyl ester carboxylesterase
LRRSGNLDAVPEPALNRYDAPPHDGAAPRGVLLMLHGGKPHSTHAVTGRSASWRRSLSMQREIARPAQVLGLSTWLLRYAVTGWNDPASPSPVRDARWALDQVRAALGPVPVVLLGHSMGARTAVRVADDPAVVGVVALAPWFPADEPVDAIAGKPLVAVQGRHDRITSYDQTRQFVERSGPAARLVDMGAAGHYMLRQRRRWNQAALSAAADMVVATAE